MKTVRIVMMVLAAFILVNCGGGGSSAGSTAPATTATVDYHENEKLADMCNRLHAQGDETFVCGDDVSTFVYDDVAGPKAFIKSGKHRYLKMALINKLTKKYTYVSDEKQYGKLDYYNILSDVTTWDGDCEDLAYTASDLLISSGDVKSVSVYYGNTTIEPEVSDAVTFGHAWCVFETNDGELYIYDTINDRVSDYNVSGEYTIQGGSKITYSIVVEAFSWERK